jgi:hypothetical protein
VELGSHSIPCIHVIKVYVGGPKTSNQGTRVLHCFFILKLAAKDRGQNQDALLALLHASTEFVPCPEAGDATGVGFCDAMSIPLGRL